MLLLQDGPVGSFQLLHDHLYSTSVCDRVLPLILHLRQRPGFTPYSPSLDPFCGTRCVCVVDLLIRLKMTLTEAQTLADAGEAQ